MKIVSIVLLVLFSLSGCSSKNVSHDGSYNQANHASKEAHKELMRDVK